MNDVESRTSWQGLVDALSNVTSKTPRGVIVNLEALNMTVLRGGDANGARKHGVLAILRRTEDSREVILDKRAVELAALVLGLRVVDPLGGMALRRLEQGAHPAVRFDEKNVGAAFGHSFALLVDGHDDTAGVYVADGDALWSTGAPLAGAAWARRVAAALNATRFMDVEDMEKLG